MGGVCKPVGGSGIVRLKKIRDDRGGGLIQLLVKTDETKIVTTGGGGMLIEIFRNFFVHSPHVGEV